MTSITALRMLCALTLLLLVACSDKQAPMASQQANVTVLAEGLEHPWAMAFLPSGDVLITERPGRLKRFSNRRLYAVAGAPNVAAERQGGLLDIALHPDFAENRWVYLSYAKRRDDGLMTTAVGRGRFDGTALTDFEDILIADAWTRHGVHFGSRLLFDRERYLYVTVGDRGERDQAQNPRNHIGTTLRVRDDGSVPDDNPFVGNPDAADEVWTYGNRNAQGMALHPQTGAVWQHEHGPRGGDEINLIRPGLNYGWPDVTHGREYYGPRIGVEDADDIESPLKHWTPSIAPSGMTFYQGDVLVGALVGQHIARVRFDATREVEETRWLVGYARFRDVRTGPDGKVYALTDAPDGQFVRIDFPSSKHGGVD